MFHRFLPIVFESVDPHDVEKAKLIDGSKFTHLDTTGNVVRSPQAIALLLCNVEAPTVREDFT